MADQTIPAIQNLRGNIGIGTATPEAKLDIKTASSAWNVGASFNDSVVRISGEADGANQGGLGLSYTNSGGAIIGSIQHGNDYKAITMSGRTFKFEYGSAQPRFFINSAGNVGIGTTSPSAKLHVVGGDIRTENRAFFAGRRSASEPSFSFHDDSDTGMFNIASNILAFATSGSERVRIASNGLVTFAGTGGGALTIGSHIDLGDNQQVRLGASDDLSLYHEPSVENSYIDNITGDLFIRNNSNDSVIIGHNANKGLIYVPDGRVELRFNDSKKFETTNDGVSVTGDISIPVANKLYFGGGSHTYISEDIDDRLRFFTGGAEFMRFTEDTSDTINFYKDATFAGDVVIGGGLTINGTTTTINSTTLQVDDKNIELGTVATPSDTTADGGGITLKGASDYTINWTNSTNSWHFNQGITVGENDTGYDVKFYGATSNRYLHWNQAEDRLNLRDNTKFSIGNSNDLQLEFNGTHGYIKNNVGGSLYIQTANTIQLENSSGQDMLVAASGGAVKLFHGGNSTAKFETNAGGVTVTGKMTSDTITTALSLEMFASGGNNYISSDASGSHLIIRNTGGGNTIIHGTTNENAIIAKPNGAVELYHDNAKKFETSSTGATITGNLVMGSGQVKFANGGHVMLGDSNDLRLYHNGNSYIAHDTEGDFFIQQNLADKDLVLQCDDGSGGTTDYFRLDGSDAMMKAHRQIRFLDNVKATFGNSDDLKVYHDSSDNNNYIQANNGRNIFIESNGISIRTQAGVNMITATAGGSVALTYNGGTTLETVVGGIKLNSRHLIRNSVVTFANGVANQKVDLYWTGTQQFWGEITVTVQSTYSNQNAAGSITKKFYVGLNPNNSIFTNECRYTDAGGVTGDNFAISDLRWDSTNSRYYITIVHRVSTGNQIGIKVEAFAKDFGYINNIDDITTGSVYTTDTTTYAKPYIYYNDNVGIGTSSPATQLEISKAGTSGGGVVRLSSTGETSAGNTVGKIEFYNSDTTDHTAGVMASIKAIAGPSGGEGHLQFLTDMPSEGAEANQVALHLHSNANVGIGTTSPSNRFNVVGSSALQTAVTKITRTHASASNNTYTFEVDSSSHTSNMTLGGAMAVDVNSGRAFTINGFGNVGIGTTSPSSAKLQVENSAGGNLLTLARNSTAKLDFEFGTSNVSLVCGGEIQFRANGGTTNKFIINNSQIQSNAKLLVNTNSGIDVHTSDTGTIIQSGNSSATSTPDQFFINHSGANVDMGNNRGNIKIIKGILNPMFSDQGGGLGVEAMRWSYYPNSSNYYLSLATEVPAGGVVRYHWNMKNNGTAYDDVMVFDRGNVGIGTDPDPSVQLDVGSVFKFNTSTDLLTITNNENTGGIKLSGGNSRIYFGNYRAIEGDQSGGTLYLGEGYGTISLMDDTIVTGNVGIGTTSPTSKLEVSSSGAHGINISQDTTASTLSGRLFLSNGTTNQACTLFNSGGTLRFATGAHIGNSSGDTRMTLLANGKLGVGTTSVNSGVGIQVANGAIYATNGDAYLDTINAGYFASSRSLYLKSGASGKVILTTGSNDQLRADSGGFVELSHTGSTSGGKFLTRRYSGNDYLSVFSTEYSSGSLCMGYGAAGKYGAAGFVSTYDNFSGHKTLLKINHNGINVLTTGTSQTDTVGADLSMAERFRVQVDKSYFNNGPVGIGTTSPSTPLHIDHTGDKAITIESDGDTDSNFIFMKTSASTAQVYIGHETGTAGANFSGTLAGFAVFGNVSSGMGTQFLTGGGNQHVKMTIRHSGQVGIGVTNPNDQYFNNLVVGETTSGDKGITIRSSNAAKGVLAFSDADSGTGRYAGRISYDHSTNDMEFYTLAGNFAMMIDDAQQVGIGTTSPNYLLDVEKAGANMRLYNTTTNGTTDFHIRTAGTTGSSRIFFGDTADSDIGSIIYRHNGNSLAFETNDAEAVRIDSSGQVGIGTTSPQQELDVDGVIKQKVYTLSSLPSASSSTIGARAFISDSAVQYNSSNIGQQAAYGGGSYFVPVYSDGSYWYIG